MNTQSPRSGPAHPQGPAQQSALQTLATLSRVHAGKLTLTFGLVLLENSLMVAYPLFAGFAINAIIDGHLARAMLYAGVVLAFWGIGAIRRAVDTRTFTRIYAELAVPVVLRQRSQQQSTSTAAARVVLAREFVDFFEVHVPVIATALVSLIGAVAMLLWLEPWVGAACLIALLLCALLMPGFARKNEELHGRLNNRLEEEVRLVDSVGGSTLRRHYRALALLRVRLSDREAAAYLVIGVAAATLFAIAIHQLATASGTKAGHIYSVMTYLWNFVIALDDTPSVVDQLARLKDIGKRVDPGMSADAAVVMDDQPLTREP
jgi:ABC-type multidrug transport system fused ATPase/permease subunit